MDPVIIKPGIVLTQLTPTDNFSDFDCGDEEINEFVTEQALDEIEKKLAAVYVIKDNLKKVHGCVAISMSSIQLKEDSIPYTSQPALLIGRLGVDKDCKSDKNGEKNYYGYTLIDTAVSMALHFQQYVGCRFVIVDAYPHMVGYYAKKGFETIGPIKGKKIVPMFFRLE